jgi:hypothetical protein
MNDILACLSVVSDLFCVRHILTHLPFAMLDFIIPALYIQVNKGCGAKDLSC